MLINFHPLPKTWFLITCMGISFKSVTNFEFWKVYTTWLASIFSLDISLWEANIFSNFFPLSHFFIDMILDMNEKIKFSLQKHNTYFGKNDYHFEIPMLSLNKMIMNIFIGMLLNQNVTSFKPHAKCDHICF